MSEICFLIFSVQNANIPEAKLILKLPYLFNSKFLPICTEGITFASECQFVSTKSEGQIAASGASFASLRG
jgi:hypothetical protein